MKDLNDELVSVIPENEHKTTLDWYEEQLERVQEAKLEDNAHLDKRAEKGSSGLSSVKFKLKLSLRSSQAAKIQAKN